MCSTDVLKERLENMDTHNKQEHKELKDGINKISDKLDDLVSWMEEKFVMRKEFKAVVVVLSAVATSLWIIAFFHK